MGAQVSVQGSRAPAIVRAGEGGSPSSRKEQAMEAVTTTPLLAAVPGVTTSAPCAGFYCLPPAGQALMVLGVLYILSTGSWRILLLALQASAHFNAGWNGPTKPPTAALWTNPEHSAAQAEVLNASLLRTTARVTSNEIRL